MTRPSQVSVILSAPQYDKVRLLARAQGISIPEVFRSLLEAAPLPAERK
jgi:hypothetical protein